MAAALTRLNLAPAAFWAATPRELGMALHGLAPRERRLGRDDLRRLMLRYPD